MLNVACLDANLMQSLCGVTFSSVHDTDMSLCFLQTGKFYWLIFLRLNLHNIDLHSMQLVVVGDLY